MNQPKCALGNAIPKSRQDELSKKLYQETEKIIVGWLDDDLTKHQSDVVKQIGEMRYGRKLR